MGIRGFARPIGRPRRSCRARIHNFRKNFGKFSEKFRKIPENSGKIRKNLTSQTFTQPHIFRAPHTSIHLTKTHQKPHLHPSNPPKTPYFSPFLGSFLPGEGVLSAVFYFSGNYSDGFETPLITYLHDQIFHLKKKVGPYLFWGLHINHMKWEPNLSRESGRERERERETRRVIIII